jgi:hypothetical protein
MYTLVITDGDPREEASNIIDTIQSVTLFGATQDAHNIGKGQYASIYAPDGECIFEINKI